MSDEFPPTPETPELCPDPGRACNWGKEKRDLRNEVGYLRAKIALMADDMAAIKANLAAGSERFRNAARDIDRLAVPDGRQDSLEREILTPVSTVNVQGATITVLRNIVYGAEQYSHQAAIHLQMAEDRVAQLEQAVEAARALA